MSERGFHPMRALRRWRANRASGGPSRLDLKAINLAYVAALKTKMPHDAAMELAIGGDFGPMGAIQAALLRHYGLPQDGYLVDVGCGSGRLARPMSQWLTGRYLGLDLVPDLVDHARAIAGRPDWRFEVIDHIGIPEADRRADMVCFFSVLTHLLQEQGYWYLEEARRVLKPGGVIVFSFLELRDPVHWRIFLDTLQTAKDRTVSPINVFLDRETLGLWAKGLDLDLVEIRGGAETVVEEGPLGQAVCVLRKPG